MLQPVFTSFSEKIWKIYPDPAHHRLAVESRNSDEKRIYGWSVPLDRSIAVPLRMNADWWYSLQTVHEGFSLWQGIEEEGLPIPMGIYVFDQESGALAWEEPGVRFLYCGPEVVIAARAQDHDRILLLETATGRIREEIIREDLAIDFLDEYESSRFSDLQYPEHVSPATERYAEVSEMIPTLAGQIGPVSYLKIQDYQIVHRYHMNTDTKVIEGSLSVLQGTLPLTSGICTGEYQNGFAMDSFFLMNNWVVWVEFPNKLGRLQLW